MIVSNEWYPDLDAAISTGDITSFPTKKAAAAAAKEFGWRDVVKVARRFENVWIVGRVDFQPDDECGVVLDVLRVPLLVWVNRECPVVKFRKPRGGGDEILF